MPSFVEWLVIIIIIAAIIEVLTSADESYTLPISDDSEQVYELRFSDGSRLLIYAAKENKTPLDLEKEVGNTVKPLIDPDMLANPIPVRYSGISGVIEQANDVYKWTGNTLREASTNPLAIPKLALGLYVHYNYAVVMTLFKYASNKGRGYAVALKKTPGECMAEKAIITDYIKMIRVQTRYPPSITEYVQ
jgi:hypothetical protein